MEKQWLSKPLPGTDEIKTLSSAINVSETIARLLMLRGISTFDDARSFFRPDFSGLHDPFLMADMDKAVHRLTMAVENREKILVYGDYDVDGTTAVTLVYSFLKNIGVECGYYIPDRYEEGYGFSFKGVEYAAANNFSLIITLDCGIKNGAKVDYASEKGIGVIICDHHNVGELPAAFAVLDPKREDCAYPYKGLSGCGVGFKLLQGYCLKNGIPFDTLLPYLDLLTISIGADIVPITGENRILAFYGLRRIAEMQRPGIAAMLEQASFKGTELTITDVVFILAPRINAAGRIFNGGQAVELLLAETIEEAKKLSPALEENNRTRKTLDKEITREAIQKVEEDVFYQTSFTTVVANENWHKGVVGIVASRLVEAYYKPTIVMVKTEDKMSGSARSIDGVDLFDALGKCADLLEQFGGHTMAAGLSMKPENFEAFRKRFDDTVAKLLDYQRPLPYILYDDEINFSDITPKFWTVLKQFAPFGPGNMKPVFLARNVRNAQYTRTVGEDNTHLKLHIIQKQNPGIEMNGIGFDLGKWVDTLQQGKEVDMLFTLEENNWNGQTSIQLVVKDIREANLM